MSLRKNRFLPYGLLGPALTVGLLVFLGCHASETLKSTEDPFAFIADRTWTWVDIPQAVCGNGAPTGLGINKAASSNTLVIYFQGGGACYDAASCYVFKSATFMESGYGAREFAADEPMLNQSIYFQPDNRENPFQNAHYAYLPYCTGDVHAGSNTLTYPLAPQPSFHQGSAKTRQSLVALQQAFPDVEHVIQVGVSAGAFGVAYNFGEAQKIFASAQIDLVSDSGENPLNPSFSVQWNIESPTGCDVCETNNFGTILPAYAASNPKSHFCALSFSTDTVLPAFLSMSDASFSQAISAYFETLDKMPNTKTFLASGSGHVVLGSPQVTANNQSVLDFLALCLSRQASPI